MCLVRRTANIIKGRATKGIAWVVNVKICQNKIIIYRKPDEQILPGEAVQHQVTNK